MRSVSGTRLLVGTIVMGLAVPAAIVLLLDLRSWSQFFTVAGCTFMAWGLADLLARILEKPRLKGRSARQAIDEEFGRRAKD